LGFAKTVILMILMMLINWHCDGYGESNEDNLCRCKGRWWGGDSYSDDNDWEIKFRNLLRNVGN
jgi:hypothetical protein